MGYYKISWKIKAKENSQINFKFPFTLLAYSMFYLEDIDKK